MAKVLSFFTQDKRDLPAFALIESEDSPKIFSLTPSVMKLSSNIYALNIDTAQSYWSNIAQLQNQDLFSTLEENLRRLYGKEKLIVFSDHPFQALILFTYLKAKQASGIHYSTTNVLKNIYRSLDWKIWSKCAQDIHNVFAAEKLLIKERAQFSSQLSRLKKLMDSLGVKNIGEMEQVDYHDLQRRFSKFIGPLWKWTFPEKFKDNEMPLFSYGIDSKLIGFPWIDFKIAENPEVKVHLEYPLTNWDHLKPLLEESFIKLSRFKELHSPYRVLEFQWEVVLYDLECCRLPIRFKFPIDLNQEKEKEFSSLFVQFEFAFQEFNQKLKEKYDETDHVNHAYIIGWTLEVSQRIYPTMDNNELFNQLEKSSLKFEDFRNKLKAPLRRYQVSDIPIPSLNFRLYDHQEKEEQKGETNLKLHPFHLLEKPLEIKSEEIQYKRFIERTSSNWWNTEETEDSYRDYYMCEMNKKIIYAYRTFNGKWFQHGIFS